MIAPEDWPPALRGLPGYFEEELGDAAAAGFCLRWLAACAAYPLLRWPITTALGEALAQADDRPPPDEDVHLALGRLPWFRDGRMPIDIRLALLRWQGAKDRRLVRDVLVGILTQALDRQAHAGRPATTARPDSHALARLVEDLPGDALQADPLLPILLRGQRPNALNLAVAALRMRAPRRLRPWTRVTRLGAVALVAGTLSAVVFGGPWLLQRFDLLTPRAQDEIDIVHIRLSACSADPGADLSLRLGTSPVTEELIRSVVLEKTADWRSGFDLIAVDSYLSLAATQETGHPTRLWDLGAGGNVILTGQVGDILALTSTSGDAVALTNSRSSPSRQLWSLDGKSLAIGDSNEIPLPPGNIVSFESRAGNAYWAIGDRDGVRLQSRGPDVDLISIPWNSPLGGIGRTKSGKLAVITCDPTSKVSRQTVPTAGPSNLAQTPGPPDPAPDAPMKIWPLPTLPGMTLVQTYVAYFDFDQYDLNPVSQAIVAQVAKEASAIPGARLLVEGHSDMTQTREYALAIASRRATAVRDGLIAMGANGSAVSTLSFGQEQPAIDREGREPLNRRAEIYLFAPATQVAPTPPVEPPLASQSDFRAGQYRVTFKATAGAIPASITTCIAANNLAFNVVGVDAPSGMVCSWERNRVQGGFISILGTCRANGIRDFTYRVDGNYIGDKFNVETLRSDQSVISYSSVVEGEFLSETPCTVTAGSAG